MPNPYREIGSKIWCIPFPGYKAYGEIISIDGFLENYYNVAVEKMISDRGECVVREKANGHDL